MSFAARKALMLPLCATPHTACTLHKYLFLFDAYSYIILCYSVCACVCVCLHACWVYNHSASAHDLAEYHVENP